MELWQPLFSYGLTHSALGLYGRFVVLLRLWYSHSLLRVSIQPLSWYTQPHGNFTSFKAEVASSRLLVSAIVQAIQVFIGRIRVLTYL